MSNLYSITRGQQAFIELTCAMRDKAANLPHAVPLTERMYRQY